MSLVRFSATNHPQQVSSSGASDEIDDRATHPTDFAIFDSELGPFTLDVAAAAHNTKCARYFTIADDGLSQPWADELVWCNPPYSNIAAWVTKAWAEAPTALGIVMLLPANRTEQNWWQELVEPFRDTGGGLNVRFLRGRLRFIKAGKREIGPNERPPFGVCLLIWEGGARRPVLPQDQPGLWEAS